LSATWQLIISQSSGRRRVLTAFQRRDVKAGAVQLPCGGPWRGWAGCGSASCWNVSAEADCKVVRGLGDVYEGLCCASLRFDI
jgi:hypothetical protein